MVENVITSRVDIQGYENIKQLKDTITSLRKEMNELDNTTEAYKETSDKLVQAEYDLRQAMALNRKDISASKGSYNELQNQLAALRKVWKETTDESLRAEYGRQMNELNNALKELDATYGEHHRKVGDYRGQLKDLKFELATLEKGTAEYNAKLVEAANIMHTASEQQEALKYSSTDLGDQMSNVTKIGSSVAGGFAALNAAMGLFGKDTEDVQKALLTVQQTMAIMQGMEGLEGLWKRTEGLSQALGLAKASTTEATVAMEAEGAAMKTAAVETTLEAGATKGAEKAQKGLNAAMKANPIGIILTAVMALVSIFLIFKDRIKDLIGQSEGATKTFDKLKTTFSGIANVVKKAVLLPIKQTITTFKTLGNVINAIIHGQFGELKQIVIDGAKEMANNAKEALDVVGNFQEGAAEKQEKLDEKRKREQAKARTKELDDIIKDNEAKYGSDYKYTKDAKKIYDEFYQSQIDQYEEGTEEYKQALRDRDNYDRLFNEKQSQATQKRIEEEVKAQQTVIDDWKQLMKSYVQTEGELARDSAQQKINIWKAYVEQMHKEGLDIPRQTGDLLTKMMDKVAETGFIEPLEEAFEKMDTVVRDRLQNKLTQDLIDFYYKGQLDLISKDETILKAEEDMLKGHYALMETYTDMNIDFEIKKENELYEKRSELYSSTSLRLKKFLDEIKPLFGEDTATYEKYFAQVMALQTKYDAQMEQNEADHNNKISDLRVKKTQQETSAIKKTLNEQLNDVELAYKERASKINPFFNASKAAKEEVDEIYFYKNKALEEQKKVLEEALTSNMLTKEDYSKTLSEIYDIEKEQSDLAVQHEIDNANRKKEAWNNFFNGVKDSANAVGDLVGKWGDTYASLIDMEVKEGKLSEQEAEKKYKTVQGVMAAQAEIQTLAAAISAYQSMASIPYVGPVLGAAAALAALQYGYAQVEMIKATNPYSSGGKAQEPSTAIANPTMADYSPQTFRNITSAQETENLVNAMEGRPLWVSVTDVDRVQGQVKAKDKETTF